MPIRGTLSPADAAPCFRTLLVPSKLCPSSYPTDTYTDNFCSAGPLNVPFTGLQSLKCRPTASFTFVLLTHTLLVGSLPAQQYVGIHTSTHACVAHSPRVPFLFGQIYPLT